jgi:hydrogenase maturation protease
LKRTIVFGYGNPDRQDDGVAWHVLVALAKQLGRQAPLLIDDEFLPADGTPDLRYDLQLTPELAEILAGYQRACFVDAHTGNIPDEISLVAVKGEFQRSPFTHHMTPATCLAMTQTLYGSNPETILVSVRGYEFGFEHTLSVRTRVLADRAAERIYAWLTAGEDSAIP